MEGAYDFALDGAGPAKGPRKLFIFKGPRPRSPIVLPLAHAQVPAVRTLRTLPNDDCIRSLTSAKIRHTKLLLQVDFLRTYQETAVVVDVRVTVDSLCTGPTLPFHSIVIGTREFKRGPRRFCLILMSRGRSSRNGMLI